MFEIDSDVAETAEQRRSKIVALEQSMQAHPDSQGRSALSHRHYLAPGVYVREVFVPAGTCVTGKVHLFDHVCLVLGDITEYTPQGTRRITGYETFVAPAGTKRAVVAHTDTWWTTVHPNPENKTDLEALEHCYVTDTFEHFDLLLAPAQEALQ